MKKDFEYRLQKFKSKLHTHNLRWLLLQPPEVIFLSRFSNPATDILLEKYKDLIKQYG